MEMNKGEAQKCMDIGKRALRSGNYAQAIKFFDKSYRMYPLPGVEALKARAEQELAKETSASSTASGTSSATSSASHTARKRTTHSAPASAASEETARPYTAEQQHIVQKIRACKTHYDVLQIPKSADDATVKKAYRKLALKLHPDKNSAPGAEDAFKAVGKAFAVLSDPDKRAHYDRYGEDAPNNGSNGFQQRRYRSNDDISPEEIFNMFFGGGFNPQRTTRHYPQRTQGGYNQQQHQANQPRGMLQFVQLLPILLIFLLSLFSGMPSGPPEHPFSMRPQGPYTIQRQTQMADVVKGIPYYVARDFSHKYTKHWRDLLQVEKLVEHTHIREVTQSCENQKLKQKRMIYRARQADPSVRDAKMRKALEMKLTACEALHSMERTNRY